MFNNFPEQLISLKQWVCYKAVSRNGKITKVPVDPFTTRPIDCNKEENWLSFDEALSLKVNNDKVSGIGFVFTERDPFVGIDIDHCVNHEGNLSVVAQEVIKLFKEKAYIEFSPSGQGIHIIAIGKKKGESAKNSEYGIEMYDKKRYFTVTGNMIGINPELIDCTNEIEEFYNKYFVKKEETQPMVSTIRITGNDILEAMFTGRGGDRLRSLYEGEWKAYYKSQSEADIAFCNALAFYTAKDSKEMDAIFRRSGLFRPKWDQIHYSDGRTYGEETIEQAIKDTKVVYSINENQTGIEGKQSSKELPDWYVQTSTSISFKSGILAKYLAENENLIYANNRFYQYESGVYNEVNMLKVQGMIQSQLLEGYSKAHHITDTLEQWKLRIAYDGDLLNAPQLTKIINFRNGLLDLNEKLLKPHTAKLYTTLQINAEYSPSANCPLFKQYIQKSLEPTDVKIAQEIMGYLLIPVTVAEKAFILYGPGRSGKSTFLKVIEELLGKKQISNVALQDLSQRFKASLLVGKLANIYADLPSKALSDTGVFKTLVSGDTIAVEEKFGKPFSYSNKARLIFSCNELPANYIDRTDGFFRRLIILPFLRQVPESEIDPFLFEKFQSEIDGIVQWALEGLYRLIDNKFQFTKSDTNKKLLDEYRKLSNNVIWFVDECCELVPEAFEYSGTLYQTYRRKCLENGLQPVSQTKFNKSIENDYSGKIIRTEDPKNRKIICKGIVLKP